jgi:ketosteroid isomerase-like protein
MSHIDDLRTATKVLNDEGVEAVLDRYTDDAVVYATALGITATGKAEIKEKIGALVQQISLKQEFLDVFEAAPFVVATARFTSNLRPEPIHGTIVSRFEGDLVAEQWTITPPLPNQ